MSSSSKKEINAKIRKIIRIPTLNNEDMLSYLDNSLKNITIQISSYFEEEKISKFRKFQIGSVDTEYSITYGISRSNEIITIADWIFDLPKMMKIYILQFIIIKESTLHVLNPNLDNNFSEIEEVIANISSILLLTDAFSVIAYDNPLIASIRARIYPSEICGKENIFWDKLLNLLFSKKISFVEVLKLSREIFSNRTDDITEEDIINAFSKWVFDSTVKEEDVIIPIYLTDRLITIVDQLLEFGYEDGTAPNIASKINLHENTVRNQMTYLTQHNSTFWRPELNLEKLNLNSYFLKIIVKESSSFEKINQMIVNIPYVKAVYHSINTEDQIIYSPLFFCPHLIANNLDAKLIKLQKENIIESYTLQIVQDRKLYATITNYPFKPNKKTFQDLIDGKHNQILHKYTFSHSKKDFTLEIEDDVPFDYNLLYFFTILQNKYLLRSRYGVVISELQKLFEINNIDNVDVIKQTDFLNQIEIRARKRGFLSYSFFIRTLTRRGSEVFVMEIIDIDDYTPKIVDKIIDKLCVFSLIGQITLNDRIILVLPGVTHRHYISEIIQNEFNEAKIKTIFYTIRLANNKLIRMHELYDFDEQKWKIVGI
ncbi:MAG: hypothetical protein JJE41_14770 [Candidatus Heimdallarchaeota archaeon]|nr:hypothetical protein [Candidatus Heimdallarchaeota archaeon]